MRYGYGVAGIAYRTVYRVRVTVFLQVKCVFPGCIALGGRGSLISGQWRMHGSLLPCLRVFEMLRLEHQALDWPDTAAEADR